MEDLGEYLGWDIKMELSMQSRLSLYSLQNNYLCGPNLKSCIILWLMSFSQEWKNRKISMD